MITTIASVASAVAALAGLLFRLERRMGDKLAERTMERDEAMERHVMGKYDAIAQWLARIEGRMDSWFAAQEKEVA